MLARSQVTADGITTGRFYEVKCFTKDGNHVLIINNRFQKNFSNHILIILVQIYKK